MESFVIFVGSCHKHRFFFVRCCKEVFKIFQKIWLDISGTKAFGKILNYFLINHSTESKLIVFEICNR